MTNGERIRKAAGTKKLAQIGRCTLYRICEQRNDKVECRFALAVTDNDVLILSFEELEALSSIVADLIESGKICREIPAQELADAVAAQAAQAPQRTLLW